MYELRTITKSLNRHYLFKQYTNKASITSLRQNNSWGYLLYWKVNKLRSCKSMTILECTQNKAKAMYIHSHAQVLTITQFSIVNTKDYILHGHITKCWQKSMRHDNADEAFMISDCLVPLAIYLPESTNLDFNHLGGLISRSRSLIVSA